jgi:hypothetical protein
MWVSAFPWLSASGTFFALKVLGRTSFLDLALITVFFGFVWWLNESYSVGRLRQERATLLSMTAPDFSSECEARVSLRAHPLAG